MRRHKSDSGWVIGSGNPEGWEAKIEKLLQVRQGKSRLRCKSVGIVIGKPEKSRLYAVASAAGAEYRVNSRMSCRATRTDG